MKEQVEISPEIYEQNRILQKKQKKLEFSKSLLFVIKILTIIMAPLLFFTIVGSDIAVLFFIILLFFYWDALEKLKK